MAQVGCKIFLCLVAVTSLWAGRKLVPEEFVVKPGVVRYWRFSINGPTSISGRFRASGGSRNDIEAIIAEWSECENWINGNRANVVYSSGPVTNGRINVRLVERGEYCIAFNNKMSVVSAKEVAAAIEID